MRGRNATRAYVLPPPFGRSIFLGAFHRLRKNGPLYTAIAKAIKAALRDGNFDRPRRGHVRAILPDPTQYTPEDWRRCIQATLTVTPRPRDETLRTAATWAATQMGLSFTRLRRDGTVLRALDEALGSGAERLRDVQTVRQP